MKIHELKIKEQFFKGIEYGKKTAEIRYNDRDFQVGDILLLKEIDKNGLETKRYMLVDVLGITTDKDFEGLAKGYVMLSIDRIKLYYENGALGRGEKVYQSRY